MPPRPRRTFTSRSRSARRRLNWVEFDASIAMTANNQWITLDLLQTYKAAVGNTIAGVTIMRTHLTIVPQALTTRDRFWTGIKVYDLNDITSAVTVNALVPNPHDNPYLQWSWMSKHITDQSLFVHPNGCNVSETGSQVVLDLKSKRKLGGIQETWGFCLYQDTVTTVAKTYDLFVRTLIALP